MTTSIAEQNYTFIQGTPKEQELATTFDKLIQSDGFTISGLELNSGKGLLCIFIDRLNAVAESPAEGKIKGSNIELDDCVQISQWISDFMDAEGITDSIPGNFNLEVSSPGFDRLLCKTTDFQYFIDEEIQLNLRNPILEGFPDRRKVRCTITETNAEGVTIRFESKQSFIPFNEIYKAKVIPNFDKALQKSQKQKAKGSHKK